MTKATPETPQTAGSPGSTAPSAPPTPDLAALRQELHGYLARLAVRHGTFTLSSGAVSDLYVDCRVVTTIPRAMRCIGALMLSLIEDLHDLRGVGGLAIGADPIAAAVAIASLELRETGREIPMFMVRKEPKAHGLRRRIEGAFPDAPGAPVMIVDDVITRGGSVLQAIEAVEAETEATVARVVLIVDRLEGGAELLRQKGYDVRSIFTRHDFVPPAG